MCGKRKMNNLDVQKKFMKIAFIVIVLITKMKIDRKNSIPSLLL